MANVPALQHTYPSAAARADDEVNLSRHAHEAYGLLHLAFVIAPVVAGLDKFFHLLTDWDKYVSPFVARALPVSVHTFMRLVGVISLPHPVRMPPNPDAHLDLPTERLRVRLQRRHEPVLATLHARDGRLLPVHRLGHLDLGHPGGLPDGGEREPRSTFQDLAERAEVRSLGI